ncbi:T-complex 11, partial [Patellaria atrata CBS 101060]
AKCFAKADRVPPITRNSLSELDIGAIINNPKLRHDLNFDRELHFRPNLDGEKGKEKKRTEENWLSALVAEIELFRILGAAGYESTPLWNQIREASQPRLPKMFDNVKEILKNLSPEKDHARIDEQFDVPLLMQQIERGICDLVGFAEWLAHLLKAHCAPMRDDSVEEMVRITRKGSETGNAKDLVAGLKQLLDILENMKLDVANHQVRHLRALLIEDTINFEQKYHLHRISRGRINDEFSLSWYLQSKDSHLKENTESVDRPNAVPSPFGIFIHALLKLVTSPDVSQNFPETFSLDDERLRTLRAELHDEVYFEICYAVFKQLLNVIKENGHKPRGEIEATTKRTLRSSLFAILGECTDQGGRSWARNTENVAVELVRRALLICGASYPHRSDALLGEVEQRLLPALSSPFSIAFAEHAEVLEVELSRKVHDLATAQLSASPMALFNNLAIPSAPPPPPPPPVPSAVRPSPSTKPPPPMDRLTEFARRIAHIAVLHWRIWAPMVYL